MNCVCEMINATTGECIYTRELNYKFALNCDIKYDAGRRELDKILCSALRGSRIKNDPISVLVTFNSTKERLNAQQLPFQPECDEIIEKF